MHLIISKFVWYFDYCFSWLLFCRKCYTIFIIATNEASQLMYVSVCICKWSFCYTQPKYTYSNAPLLETNYSYWLSIGIISSTSMAVVTKSLAIIEAYSYLIYRFCVTFKTPCLKAKDTPGCEHNWANHWFLLVSNYTITQIILKKWWPISVSNIILSQNLLYMYSFWGG